MGEAAANSLFSTINLNDPEPWSNKRPVIQGIIITFLISSCLCVCARLYTRFRIIREPGWDDLCVLCYTVFTISGTVSVLFAVEYGLGQHFFLLSVQYMQNYLKSFYTMNLSYTASTTFIKEALLLQYLRIQRRGTITYRITSLTAVFVALWGFSYTIIAIVPCWPIQHFWESPVNKRCWGYGSPIPTQFVGTYESHTAINMVLDFIVLIIPLPMMFKDDTPWRQKLRIMALVFFGSLVIVIATWRLATIIQFQAGTWPTYDPTWYGPISILLAALEVDAAAICASIPVFWPVVEAKWGAIFVTQEVKITRQTRLFDEDDVFPMPPSRQGSETELRRNESNRMKTDPHYNDSYVMHSVDPLRSPGHGALRTEASIRSNSTRKKRWQI